MGTIKTTNIEPIADNGTVTLGGSGDTFTVPSGVTVNMSNATQTGVGETNTPAFYAYKSSGQSISDNTLTKVTFETELFDSDGKFAGSRFTPTVAGYYFVSSTVSITNLPYGAYCLISPTKNGTQIFYALNVNGYSPAAVDTPVTATFMVYLDADDYLEIFIEQNAGTSQNTRTGQEVRFMAQRITGA